MAFTEATTRALNDLITVPIWNGQLVDNINYLYKRILLHIRSGASFSTTSNTYTNVGAALTGSFTTSASADVIIIVTGSPKTNEQRTNVMFDVSIDGTRIEENAGNSNGKPFDGGGAHNSPMTLIFVLRGLSAGSHTIALQWWTQQYDWGGAEEAYLGVAYGPTPGAGGSDTVITVIEV